MSFAGFVSAFRWYQLEPYTLSSSVMTVVNEQFTQAKDNASVKS